MRTGLLAVFGLACALISGCSNNCTAKISGTVSVTGLADASGTKVTLLPLGQTTQTDAAGGYNFCVPAGKYSLQFSNQGHTDAIADVEATNGGLTEVVDMAFYPLSAFELAPGTRLQTLSDPATAYLAVIQSADAQSVLFVSSSDGGELFHSTLTTGVTETVASGQISSEGFSNDGQWLFWVQNGTLKVQPAAGGDVTTLQPFVNGVVQSSDRRYLAYADPSNVYLLPLGTTQPVPVGPWLGSCASSFNGVFAPDDSLVWASGASNQACEPQSLHIALPGGDPQQTVPQVSNPTLSPDGRLLVYTVGACQGPSEGCGAFNAGTLTALTVGSTTPISVGVGAFGAPVFSNDDSKILYQSNAGEVVVARSDGSGSHVIASGGDSCQRVFGLSPDGQFDLFEQSGGNGCELFASNDGAAPVQLSTNLANRSFSGGCSGSCPGAWAFAGASVLFLDGVTVPNGPAKLEQATLGGGGVTTIAAGVGGSVQLTPDGSKMLFAQPAASGEGDVFWIDLANPVPVRLGGAGYPGLLSPDGASGLVFTDCTPTCRLQVVEMKSGKATPISANATAALWGPGSDVVALVSGEPGKPGAVSLAGIDGNGATEVLSSGELVRWVDAHRLLARRLGVAAPYSFQNGLYLFSWP